MLQFEELRLKLQGMEPELRELKQSLNIDKLGIEIAELERKAAEPSFWDDMENSQKVLQRTSQLKASVETYNKLQSLYEDTLTLIELAEEAGDESVYEEAAADTEQLQTRMAEAAPRHRIGRRCCTACTPAGRSATATPIKYWTTSTATKRASKAPPSSSRE